MIRLIRTAEVPRSKWTQAVDWSNQVTRHLNSAFPETRVEVFRNRFGLLNRIIWSLDFESLADLDRYQEKVGTDPGYADLVEQSEGLFESGTIKDTVLASL